MDSRTKIQLMYIRHARMLVPKFSYPSNGNWHIQWPKDDATIICASTQDDLVLSLAARLQQLGRVGNVGRHVAPEKDCPKCKLDVGQAERGSE